MAMSALLVTLLFFVLLRRYKSLRHLVLAWYVLFFLGGLLNTAFRHVDDHTNTKGPFYIELQERPIEKTNSYSAKAQIISDSSRSFSENYTLVYFEKDERLAHLLPGDQLEIFNDLQEVQPPKNPKEFDYQSYLELLNIQTRVYLKTEQWQKISTVWSLRRSSARIQSRFNRIIKDFDFGKEQTAVLQALLIGNRFALSDELTASYASAGAMHVLAVSGLHVGILLFVLLHLSKPLLKWNRGKTAQVVFVLLGIWSYAFVTGLSPSVLRASTMFTFIFLGRYAKRDVGIYNALLTSAFFLLLLQPNLIFQVGFQLSYAAVLGIVYLQPKFYALLPQSRFWLVDKAWAITSVSVAAQIATFPLSIYYFHQFPLLFLFSNLVVIVVTYAIMGIGLVSLLLGGAGLFISPEFHPLNFLVSFMNTTVEWIQAIPNSVVFELSIERFELVLLYAIILTVAFGLVQRHFKFLSIGLVLFAAFTALNIYENHEMDKSREITFFSVEKSVALQIRQGREAVLLADPAILENPSKMQFHINQYLWSQNLKKLSFVALNETKNQTASVLYRAPFIYLSDGRAIALVNGSQNLKEEATVTLNLKNMVVRFGEKGESTHPLKAGFLTLP